MPTKNNIYEHFQGDEEFVKRMLDLMDRMQRSYRVIYTPFLTSAQQQICRQIFGKQILYRFFGGYPMAEHQCLVLYPDECYEDRIHMPICCLKATFAKKYGSLEHRDVLGALMNLGIRREQFGDILVQDGTVYVFVLEDIKEYIKLNCDRIKRFSVQFEECDEEVHHEVSLEYHSIIISSLRLDAVVSQITHVSRSKAQAMILAKLVKVDQMILEDCSYLCNNNCVLSIRGYGRFLMCLKTVKRKREIS